MMSDTSNTTSCSDCRQEHIEQRWIQLMLNWLNKCVHPEAPIIKLNNRSLIEVVYKYRKDICDDDLQEALLSSQDAEPFIRYNYPLLRLKYICEEKDYYKKLYIMTAVLLYHCCVSSIDGDVDSDICTHLSKEEQELILKYCENLTEMEVTSNNIDCAIKQACEAVPKRRHNNLRKKPAPNLVAGSGESYDSPEIDTTIKPSSPDPDQSSSSLSDTHKKIRFDSAITVLPSALTENSSYSDPDYTNFRLGYTTKPDYAEPKIFDDINAQFVDKYNRVDTRDFIMQSTSWEIKDRCQPGCECSRCSIDDVCCGDPGGSMKECIEEMVAKEEKCCKRPPRRLNLLGKLCVMLLVVLCIVLLIALLMAVLSIVSRDNEDNKNGSQPERRTTMEARVYHTNTYMCINNLCQKVYVPTTEKSYLSMSRCILQCMGPQLWPYPIGYTFYSKKIVALATNRLEYKFQSVPSESVHSYLAEAFKLFISELAHLEKINKEGKNGKVNNTNDLHIKKMNIQLNIESDADPRLRVDTDESYNLKIDCLNNVVMIKIVSPSFCGIRHGLETLSQLILLDQATGYLITLSSVVIRDAPSYKYRGLMVDTGRNYIPMPDLMRTIDAMSTCKLNTFHWRISDVTSFPLFLPKVPELFEYGAYDKSLVYTKEDVKALVKRAGIRGIRVLIEVAAPGPVGRPWSWLSDISCPMKSENNTCSNVLCARMSMKDSVLDVLQVVYSEIIDMTKVDDIFHLSDSVFSLTNCYYLVEDREGFLDKALERLKLANKGFIPTLPIIWYTKHLTKEVEAKAWDRLGVQLNEWQATPSDQFLSRYKVIHSSKWDLSCEVKKQRCIRYRTWQNMYSWKSWRNLEVFTIEGGESILWTDLVDSGNLDLHLWPRAAAVAERLWSDIATNSSATPSVYLRLDSHRWRLLLKAVKVQPVWPVYCTFNPEFCIRQLQGQKKKKKK